MNRRRGPKAQVPNMGKIGAIGLIYPDSYTGLCFRYNSRFCVPHFGRGVGTGSRKQAMPIYAYRCASCGFEKDTLQKLSDAPLTHCPECGKETYSKQVTAAGFQLKGSGWYVTDFRGGNTAAAPKPAGDSAAASGDAAPAKAAGAGDSGSAAASGSSAAGSSASSTASETSSSSSSSSSSAPAAASGSAAKNA